MKLFYVLLAFAFVIPQLSSAQYLAENMTAANPLLRKEITAPRSQWQKEQDQVNGHISNSKLSKMKAVTTTIVNFFHDSCISDEQTSPVWHGEYFSERSGSVTRIKFGAFCNFTEQKASLSIVANDISPLLDHLVINNQDFLTLKIATAVKNDCPYFEYTSDNTNNSDNTAEKETGLRTKVWLITAGNDQNQLPYTPVTRKEYLQQARLELITTKNGIVADWKQKVTIRSSAIQAAEKKATLDQLSNTYSGLELQVRIKMFLKDYKTDEEYLKENTDKGTADLDSTLHRMDNLSNHLSAQELGKPAVVSVEAAAFRGFEDGHSDKMLIRINPTYFNPYLSEEKPQLFLVTFKYDPSQLAAGNIDQQIGEHLDCQLLKDLLGK